MYIEIQSTRFHYKVYKVANNSLLHNFLNFVKVVLDLILELRLFHLFIPIFWNEFSAWVVRTGGLCNNILCLVLWEWTDELITNMVLNMSGIWPVWNLYMNMRVLSVISWCIGRTFILINRGLLEQLYSEFVIILIAFFCNNLISFRWDE